ncbi:hypothetical protein E3Q02_01064 [Wallemia mellicola]|uniref:Enoyl reductase (ER) domain-containing protein n=1 Tax=Wallemia mellicola TaxID=1708541 RepID=A0AB38MZ17_9BASI|nr:hypothetical protein E3Q02_01064 [Wallemia mellicola]
MATQKVFRLPNQSERTSHKAIKESLEPIPQTSSYEVLINIKAVSLNYRDIVIANGKYPFPVKDKVVPCSDGAGVVEKVGDSVKNFKKGDRVIGSFDPTNLYGPQLDWNGGLGGPVDGNLRDYITLPATSIIKIPEENNLSFPQLASLVCTGTTVWNAFYGNQPLIPGTGGVSITGLILAKAAGASTIITSSSDDKLKYVKDKFGVDYTINYKSTPNWTEVAKEITKGEGVDHIIENGGSGTIKQSLDCLKMGGIISVIGFLSLAKQDDMPDVALLALSKGCIVRGITVGSKQLTEQLVNFVSKKDLHPPVEKVFEFSHQGIIAAYDYLESGNHTGKICISKV